VPKYLVTYHGGEGMPSSTDARQQVLAAFGAWAASVGDAMVDPGAPLTLVKTVSSRAVTDWPLRVLLGATPCSRQLTLRQRSSW